MIAGPWRVVDTEVVRPAVPLCEPRRRAFRFGDENASVAGTRHGCVDGNRKRAAQVGEIVVRVLDVGLRRDRVMRREVPVDHLGAPVVVIGGQVHVFGRQNRQADDAERPQASRHPAQKEARHGVQYNGRGPEESVNFSSGSGNARNRVPQSPP